MYRLTARLLLLFAIAGNCVPLAMAMRSAPTHACCVRKVHHCHELATESAPAEVGSTGCCGHDGCGAALTGQWAHPRPSIAANVAQAVDIHGGRFQAAFSDETIAHFQPARAPPEVELA